MAVETELKLSVAPEHLDRLKRHPLIRQLAATRAVTRHLYSVYYDTPDLALQRSGMALRLRRAGKHWQQTLKAGGSVQAGLHLRNEWETPVAGETLDFDALQACGAPALPAALRRKLRPVFVTDFSRNMRMLEFEGAGIELALDGGAVRAGRKSRPISEVELELRSGSPVLLFKLAQALLDIVPLAVEHTSKAEYGYRLCGGDQPGVRKASLPALVSTQSIPSALQQMIASSLAHVQANVAGAISGRDEEYLHQVRVGLRRLRVVLAMTECYRADVELAMLHRQVADLCIEFGGLREWDVLVTQTLAPACARLPEHAGLRLLFKAGAAQRARHHADVVRALRSADYQRLLLRFGAWANAEYWREQPAQDDASLTGFVVQDLQRRCRQVHKRGKLLAAAQMQQGREDSGENAQRLHALRIACKKLRYSAEMFGSLFAAGDTRRYVAALAAVQDVLGTLNDLAVARRLLDRLESSDRHPAIELMHGWIEHEHAQMRSELGKAWKRFSRHKPFWK